MHFGVYIFPTDTTLDPVSLARAVEERGFESLWFPEHSHIPAARTTPWGGRAGAPPLPDKYWRTHDQFVALGACAAVTSTLRLGTGISLVAQRDPIWLAKEVASLDTISGGRVLFGIGYGWNKEEMAHHGVAYTQRRAILREKVLAMKQIWTEEEASFDGRYVRFGPSWSWPKPVQQPHPPVILGGSAGPRTMADIVEFCDGWMPIGARHLSTDRLAELRRIAEEAGRDPASIELGVWGVKPEPDRVAALEDAGVVRMALEVPSEAPDAVLAHLDDLAEAVSKLG